MPPKTKSKAPANPPVLPVPSREENEAIKTASERVRQRKPRISLNVGPGAKPANPKLGPPHADAAGWLARLQDAFGTPSTAFASAELNHLLGMTQKADGTWDATRIDALLAVVDGAQPANEIEAMLACQMAVTHGLIMNLIRRAARADQISQFEAAGGMAAKLLKAFAGHAELLNKLKRGGEQTMRIEHVHVHPGGQAIVGKVTTGGRGVEKNGDQPHAPGLSRPNAPPIDRTLRREDSMREPVPVAGRQD